MELQAHTVIRKLTDNQEEYEFLERLIDSQKPKISESKHHYLIKTPFRYPLPVKPQHMARFKPPFYHRNNFYGSEHYRTSAYEYAYHWLAERVHITGLSQEPQPRTHFQVRFSDIHCVDLRKHAQIKSIMNRRDYTLSHQWIEANPKISSILYPSCRDPENRNCIVTFEISTLGKQPRQERTLDFIYQASQRMCLIQDPLLKERSLEILWEEVC